MILPVSHRVDVMVLPTYRHIPVFAGLVLAALTILPAPELRAQPDSRGGESRTFDELSREKKKKFVDLVKSGKQAYSAGNFQKAIPFFVEAYEIVPQPELHYRIALCHERAGNPAKALERYRKFLEAKPETDKRGAVESTIDRLEERTRATVEIVTEPAEADLRVQRPAEDGDGLSTTARGSTPAKAELEPGTVVLRVDKKGFEPESERIELEAGEAYNIKLTLEERSVATPEVPTDATADKDANGFPTALAIAGGGAALGAATLYGIGTYCGANRGSCRRSLYDTAATGSYIAGGLAAVSLGTAAALWMSGPETSPNSPDQPASVQFRIGPSHVGLSARF
jgi:tetratricopeptide (TPR) repeat protein